MIRLQDTPLDPGQEVNMFLEQNRSSGGVATFVGQVRKYQDNAPVDSPNIISLELEHYPGMTEKELDRIVAEAISRWTLDKVLVIHRFGKMTPGDAIVLVCAAAPHRGEAFSACEFIMDWLKIKAPFWKREETSAGSSWVEARESDSSRAERWSGNTQE